MMRTRAAVALEAGKPLLALAYMLTTVTTCVLACWLGIIATR